MTGARKRSLYLLAALAALGLAATTIFVLVHSGRALDAKSRRIMRGMTEAELYDILGSPNTRQKTSFAGPRNNCEMAVWRSGVARVWVIFSDEREFEGLPDEELTIPEPPAAGPMPYYVVAFGFDYPAQSTMVRLAGWWNSCKRAVKHLFH